MTTGKAVFYASSAWVGRIDSETRCRFWWKHPSEIHYDHALLVPVDLAKTPASAREGRIDWDEIQVDDIRDETDEGGVTTIGPWFPDGKATGAVYLEKTYWDRLRAEHRPAFPPPGYAARDYEFKTVVYKAGTENPRAGIRYHGYHAKIISERGPSALVAVYTAGNSKGGENPAEHTFNLESIDCDAHVSAGGMTEIAVGEGKKKEGAFFIKLVLARRLGIRESKKPASQLSGESFPSPRGLLRRKGLAEDPAIAPGREVRLRRPSG